MAKTLTYPQSGASSSFNSPVRRSFVTVAKQLLEDIFSLLEQNPEDMTSEDRRLVVKLVTSWYSPTVQESLARSGFNNRPWDAAGRNIATLAAARGHAFVIHAIARAEGDLNEFDGRDRSPATAAAEAGQTDILCILHKAGVDLDEPDKQGWLPSTIAAWHGHEHVLVTLGLLGIPRDKEDGNGWSPYAVAWGKNNARLCRLLSKDYYPYQPRPTDLPTPAV